MARKKKGRPVNGILVLDKASGLSSNAALQKVKRLYNAQKAGHTGSLDPLASGVLPLCFGEATKISQFLLDADKRYRAVCRLGAFTTTGDAEGEILSTSPVPELSEAQLNSILVTFLGQQKQTPPMYSALKYQGKPLYEYARAGINVERKQRDITVFDIKLLAYSGGSSEPDEAPYLSLEVHCSKGTYIRTLCEDIAKAIGCGAYLIELRRIESGPFNLEQTVTLEQLNNIVDSVTEQQLFQQLDKFLMPTDIAITQYPMVILDNSERDAIVNGQSILNKSQIEADLYRLYFDKTLIGIGILDKDQKLKPKRLLFL